jgi:hypothetical protein
MGSALYAVKGRAIYAMRLADQTDPGRTNVAVPNTQQRLLPMGSDHPEVARIFLTAHALLSSDRLGTKFDEKRALFLAFDYLRDIAAMIDMRMSLDTAIGEAVTSFGGLNPKDRSLRLPSLGNSEERCHAFAQKVGHAVDTLKGISRLFYPNELSKKWMDSLASLAAQKYGPDDPLARFILEVRPNLLFMREMWNMIEHPQESARVDVHDFKLLPTLELTPPSVEIVRAGQDTMSGSLSSLMVQITEELVSIVETFIGLLCGANVQSVGSFKVLVVERPAEQRPKWNPHQRIYYGIIMNGEVYLLG